jgi:hypothetical protein
MPRLKAEAKCRGQDAPLNCFFFLDLALVMGFVVDDNGRPLGPWGRNLGLHYEEVRIGVVDGDRDGSAFGQTLVEGLYGEKSDLFLLGARFPYKDEEFGDRRRGFPQVLEPVGGARSVLEELQQAGNGIFRRRLEVVGAVLYVEDECGAKEFAHFRHFRGRWGHAVDDVGDVIKEAGAAFSELLRGSVGLRRDPLQREVGSGFRRGRPLHTVPGPSLGP